MTEYIIRNRKTGERVADVASRKAGLRVLDMIGRRKFVLYGQYTARGTRKLQVFRSA